jgi:hypothetical protein
MLNGIGNFIMVELKEQSVLVKFCFKLEETASKTALHDNVMGKTQTFEWYSRFKQGEISVED